MHWFNTLLMVIVMVMVRQRYLVDEFQQLILRGVHPHGPHSVAQLSGVDCTPSVNIKLIECLVLVKLYLLPRLLFITCFSSAICSSLRFSAIVSSTASVSGASSPTSYH